MIVYINTCNFLINASSLKTHSKYSMLSGTDYANVIYLLKTITEY